MKALALAGSAFFAALALVMVGFSWRSPTLTLTLRRQFDDWQRLLDLFKNVTDSDAFVSSALDGAWCNYTLPPQSPPAPFCRCVRRAAVSFANASITSDASVTRLVSCMSSRTSWRVREFWAVRYTTPALYVFFVASTFLLVQSDVGPTYITVSLWTLAAALVVPISLADYYHNGYWGFTFLVVVIVETLVLLPGMSSSSGDEKPGTLKRTPSCFWWAEYFSAPVFALYVPLMHCGRDFVYVSVFTMVGTAIGGLGLRSFWCAEVYRGEIRNQFQTVMQRIVWLGVLAASATLSAFTAIYYHSDVPYAMGPSSVAMLALTMAVSLLQWPGNQEYPHLLLVQTILAGVRNVLLFCVVIYDLWAH